MITAGMGGVLPEQTDPGRFQRVLDVGCGSGQWLIELAKTYHYQADTPTLDLFTQDLKLGFRNVQPFIRKWTRLPDDYDQLYQRALHDMQQPDFTAVWEMVTAWSTNPFN